jgi:hypothetical protein
MAHPSITATSVTGQNIPDFGDGQGLFVLTTDSETDNVTAGDANETATSGPISSNAFTFGDGNNDYVQIGNASVTATTTDPLGTATANLSVGVLASGSIFDNTIDFGKGNGDHVAVMFNDTITANSPNITNANISINPAIIDNNIGLGDGNNDYVELGGQINVMVTRVQLHLTLAEIQILVGIR